MDTSRAYVKMCRQAKKIQLAWKPQNGDWCHIGAKDSFSVILINGKRIWTDSSTMFELHNDIELYGIVWLPRIDQLQAFILSKNKESCLLLSDKFLAFYHTIDSNAQYSLEQLWLMYYMAIKFNKLWKDGRWSTKKVSVTVM